MLTFGYPLVDKRNPENEIFLGTLIWESLFEDTFSQFVVPMSFLQQKYKFIEIRWPKDPNNETDLTGDHLHHKNYDEGPEGFLKNVDED